MGRDNLSEQIKERYISEFQGWKTSQGKEEVRAELERILRRAHIPNLRQPVYVFIAGSSRTKELALEDSDLDLCIKMDRPLDPYVNKQDLLTEIAQVIYTDIEIPRSRPRVFGKKPIIIQFHVKTPMILQELKVDIQMYTPALGNSTYLIGHYIKADARFQKLAVILKLWTRKYGIDGTAKGLSSYALNLMLIHYLQMGCRPNVLPNIHKSCPHIFNCDPDPSAVREFKFTFNPRNNQNLGDLLMGFFRYYCQEFNFKTMAVAVTERRIAFRSEYSSYDASEFIFIEEPFTWKNVVALSKSRTNFDKIIAALRSGHRLLKYERNLERII